MTDLKTLLVNALKDTNLDQEYAYASGGSVDGKEVIIIDRLRRDIHAFDADRLATTILSGILDREKVRAALTDILNGVVIDSDDQRLNGRKANYSERVREFGNVRVEDDLIDRLIASLSAGVSQ